MAGTVTTNTKKYYGGLVPEPTPQGGGDGKTKVLVLRDVTVTVDEHPVTKKLLCDPDSVITVEPFIEVVTAEKLAEWLDDNYVILLDDGTQQVQMLKASVSSEGETPVCNSVVFKGLKDSKRASIEYPCQLLTDESTLTNFVEAGAAVIQEFNLVSAYPEDTTSGTLIDKLEIEDTIDDDPDYQPLLEIVPTNGKVAINKDGLHEALNELGGAIDSIVDTIDELDVDSVPHAYLHSTLAQSAGDSVATGTQINVFAQDALEGDCFEFEQTTTIDDTPFGYVWIEPGTYLINASVTLQWVGDPRGTFIAKVGSVMGENFDFSQEQEIKRNTTKIVTIPNRMKLAVNITYDAGTPVMGFWIQSMQVVKLAGGMSQTNIVHDSTLVGQGSLSNPIGVDLPNVAQSTLAGNLAPAFDPDRTENDKYVLGDLVVKDGILKRCINPHYGEWLDADFEDASMNEYVATDNSIVPNDTTSLKFSAKDKKTGNSVVIDGAYVASLDKLNELSNHVEGVPFKLNVGSQINGQIEYGKWNYVGNPSRNHYIIDVSKLRGKHITDRTGSAREYTFLTYYIAPVNGEKPFICNGMSTVSAAITSVTVPQDAIYMYIKDTGIQFDTPQLYCGDTVYGLETKAIDAANSLFGSSPATVSYGWRNQSQISTSLRVGDTIAFTSTIYRKVGNAVLNVDRGIICIDKVQHGESAYDVVLCDKDDKVIGGKTYSTDNAHYYPVYLNLEDYPGARKLYFNYSAVAGWTPTVTISVKSLEKECRYKKGVILLHFDAVEYAENGTIVSSRKALLEEYGIKKASCCLNKELFGNGNDNTFSSWRSDAIREEYESCVKDGWDFALYPSLVAQQKDEQGWNDFMDTAFGNLANLGVYNVTTWACGRLDVTHALLNACIKHNIKVVRGGSDGDSQSQGDYTYTDNNIYMPTSNAYETTLVNKTYFYGTSTDLERIKPVIRRAADTKTAISIFTHKVLDETSDVNNCTTAHFRELLSFIKSMVDAGEIEVMSWREYYASASARDGYENDYNRLLKIGMRQAT